MVVELGSVRSFSGLIGGKVLLMVMGVVVMFCVVVKVEEICVVFFFVFFCWV